MATVKVWRFLLFMVLQFAVSSGTPLSRECKAPIDLGFLIDASYNIGPKTFAKIKNFVKTTVDVFGVGPNGTYVSAIWFSDDAKVAFDFNALKGENMTKENVYKLIDGIGVTKGKTRIDKALKLAHSDLFSAKGGSRPGHRKVLLVMTNGRQTVTPVISNVENLLAKASKPLKTNGVHIHPIVSSSDFDIFNMLRIASKAQNLAYPMDIDVMKYIASDIKNQIC